MFAISNNRIFWQMDEAGFEHYVSKIRTFPNAEKNLVALLKEQHPVYLNKNTNAVIRMRGFVLYSFYISKLPTSAIMFIYEELESSRESYLVAAAAMTLRKALRKDPTMAKLLIKALNNIKSYDNYISFDNYYQKHPLGNKTTAVEQILKTLDWLGAYAKPVLNELEELSNTTDQRLNATHLINLKILINNIKANTEEIGDCCNISVHEKFDNLDLKRRKELNKKRVKDLLLQDHTGSHIAFGDFFNKKITVVTFFYTRCDNPFKCSLTITKLADLANRLNEQRISGKVNIAAITYDPIYDLPHRLKEYGDTRGLSLSNDTRMFRVEQDFEMVKQYFDLGVNYTGTVVNRHIIELYLLDTTGNIIMSFQRGQLDNIEIANQIIELLKKTASPLDIFFSRVSSGINSFSSLAMSIIILLLPKCPLCLAAYLSILGIAGIELMPYVKFIFPMLLMAMTINLYSLFKIGKKNHHFLPFYLCVFGSSLVILFGHFLSNKIGLIAGIIMLVAGAILNMMPKLIYLKLKYRLSQLL